MVSNLSWLLFWVLQYSTKFAFICVTADLINSAVGSNAEKEKRFALDQLHAVIGVKRKGVWSKIYESLMKRHIELCVDLKDHHTAKDGLHQYRNLCQSVDPNSLEVVIVYLMELSEARATAARQKADKVALAAAARVSDLDQEETPESIMLSSMTEEGAKDRTDREVVVPWLKFLWENYRAILELLYKIPKLEKVYHKTCEKAFKFCLDYTRVLEFRRLCDMLRQQLTNLQKMPAVAARTARPQWEWTPEAIEYHLQTRFSQLEVATTLELWNEGFRTVEDIYAIIVAGKKTPKAKLMVSYYEKLTRIFWVSDNKLFHAYAWYRYYSLSCDTRKDLKSEERSLLASSVLLAALTIPSTKDIYSAIAVDLEHLDELSPDASRLGAVNTVLFDSGKAIGHNTDWSGFGRNFDDGLPGAQLDRVVQLGAGGAGAAVAYAALTRGVGTLTLVDSSLPRAEELAQTFAQQFPAQVVEARHTNDLAEVLGNANGLIHATPMGMAAHPGMAFSPDLLRPDLWVAEIVYRPLETELLRQARLIGAPTLSGGGMTVFQAVDAFRIFTGIEPDSKRMLAHMTELVHGEQTAAAL